MEQKNSDDCTAKEIAENNQEACGPDGRVDALSAIGLILFVVVAAVFWVANQ